MVNELELIWVCYPRCIVLSVLSEMHWSECVIRDAFTCLGGLLTATRPNRPMHLGWKQMMEKFQNPRILNLYIAQNVEVCAVRICCGNWSNWHSSYRKVLIENLIVAQLLKIWKSFYGTRKFILNIQTASHSTLSLVRLIRNKYHESFHSEIFSKRLLLRLTPRCVTQRSVFKRTHCYLTL